MSDFDHFVGTRPVSDKHTFDTGALTAWLESHLEGFRGPLTVEMFKGGQSNPTYKLITPGKSYVMRAKPGPVAKLLPSAHAVEREFAVMQGRVLWDQSLPGMDRSQRGAIYDEMNRVISALHKVDFASRGLAGYGKPG